MVNQQRKSLVPHSDTSDSSSGDEEQHTLEADKLKSMVGCRCH